MRRAAIAGVLASTVCACIPIPQTFSRERQICVMDTDTTFGTPPSTFAIATDPGPTELEVDAPAVAVVTMHGHLNGCNSFGFGSCEVTQEDDGSLTLKAKVPAVRLVGFLVCTSDQDAPQTICTLPPCQRAKPSSTRARSPRR